MTAVPAILSDAPVGSWMRFPAWALWLDAVRFELEAVLAGRRRLALRMVSSALSTPGRAFNLLVHTNDWAVDVVQATPLDQRQVANFSITDGLVILRHGTYLPPSWNKLRGILGSLGVPLDMLSAGTPCSYRYAQQDATIHYPDLQRDTPCPGIDEVAHQGARGAFFALCTQRPHKTDYMVILTAHPALLPNLSAEHTHALLLHCVFCPRPAELITVLEQSGLVIPPGCHTHVAMQCVARDKPDGFDGGMQMIAAIEARQAIQRVSSAARAAKAERPPAS